MNIVNASNLYALACLKDSDLFAPKLSPVVGIELNDAGVPKRVLHEFASESFRSVLFTTAFDRSVNLPAMQLCGEVAYPHPREAEAALRDQHRKEVIARGGTPTRPDLQADPDIDPVTGESRADRAAKQRHQHAGVPQRISDYDE